MPLEFSERPTSTHVRSLHPPMLSEDYAEFICGFGAAVINISLTFPVNKVIFRQMMDGVSTVSAVSQLQREGLVSLYRGLLPPLCQKAITTSIMFGSYNKYSQSLKHTHPSLPPVVISAVASTAAGTTEAILAPFERIQTLLQDKHQQGKFPNTYVAIRELRKFGLLEFYRGTSAILLRNGPSNFLFFESRSFIKDRVTLPLSLQNKTSGTFLIDFISGGVVGGLISTAVYPLNLVKCKMQVSYGTPYENVFKAFKVVYAQRNYKFRNLFFGAKVNFARAMTSWGIINASYEYLKTTLFPELSQKQLQQQIINEDFLKSKH